MSFVSKDRVKNYFFQPVQFWLKLMCKHMTADQRQLKSAKNILSHGRNVYMREIVMK